MGPTPGVRAVLPPDLTSFVGRGREIRRATELLEQARLVTLTGAGGVGKTRLAVRIARDRGSRFPARVALVELGEVSDPRLVTGAVAAAIGLPDRLAEWAVDEVVAHVGATRMLLVLDNCEHLLAACADVVDRLLRATPHLTVLATSRQALGVPGEQLLLVPPLSMPPSDEMPLDVLPGYDAVSLFVERARAVSGRFGLHADNAADVVRLCRRLDGVPLAIELAAARLRVLSPAQLLQRLDDRFALLTDGPRVCVRRQRSLQSSVDWSYDLCSPDEQRAWSLLSVFEGGFGLEAAEQVCDLPPPSVCAPEGGAAGADSPRVLDLVATLVDKSVLLRDDQAGQVRYRMLETIRAYGLDRLVESGVGTRTRASHRDWFVTYAERAGRQWFGPDQAGRVARLAAELANLRAAMRSALDDGQPRQALRLASSVWFYWLGWGSPAEGRRWLSAALAADAGQSRLEPPHLGTSNRGTSNLGISHVELRVRSWGHLATLSAVHGDLEGAHQALLAARDEAAAGSGPRLRADGRRAAALAAALGNRHRHSINLCLGVLGDPSLTADEPESTVLDLEVLVSVLSLLRQHDHAIAAAERALDICAEHQEDWHRGFLLAQLGTGLWLRGSFDAAREAGRESLSVAVALNHTFGVLTALELLAWVAASTADLDRAAMLSGALATLWRSIGAPPTGSGTVPVYHEMCRARLVEEMGADAYELAVRRGGLLGIDEAVGLGLGRPCRRTGRPARAGRGHCGLTHRETEIADLVARGMTNGQIAATLVISPRTAEGHVQRILGKLDLRSRAGIAAWVADRRD